MCPKSWEQIKANRSTDDPHYDRTDKIEGR